MAKDTFRAVRGKLPSKGQVTDWADEKLHQFILFADFWIDDNSFKVDNSKRKAAEERSSSEPYWEEFMARLNMPLSDPTATYRRFLMRLMAFTRNVLSWLKENPHAVTPAMEEIMKKTDRLNWALNPVREQKSEIGADILALDKNETTDPSIGNVMPQVSNPKSPEAQYAQGMVKLASLFRELTNSISRTDMKDMSTDKKLKHIGTLARTLHQATQGKNPVKLVFKQLNINKAGRDELEKAMLDYSQEQ